MYEYPILCCDVSCYYCKKNVLRDSDRSYTTQPVQICELGIYVLEQKTTTKNIKQNHTFSFESKKKAMKRNWSNQKSNPALKTKAGNK